MQQEVAEVIVRTTREDAEQQARDDLDQLRRSAVDAGRERSRDLIKVTTIDTNGGGIHYNPAGRLLRDWYLHVYINSLRANVGQSSERIDLQQCEDAAATLRRIQRGRSADRALQAVHAVRTIAVSDSAAAATRIAERLSEVVAMRALRHVPEERFDSDQVRIHAARDWYQRCYGRAVDQLLGDHDQTEDPHTDIDRVTHVLAVGETADERKPRKREEAGEGTDSRRFGLEEQTPSVDAASRGRSVR